MARVSLSLRDPIHKRATFHLLFLSEVLDVMLARLPCRAVRCGHSHSHRLLFCFCVYTHHFMPGNFRMTNDMEIQGFKTVSTIQTRFNFPSPQSQGILGSLGGGGLKSKHPMVDFIGCFYSQMRLISTENILIKS
jgi:hypothetical protein